MEMNKIKGFLNETSEISNGAKIQAIAGVAVLYGMTVVLNHQLFKSRLDNIRLSREAAIKDTYIDILKHEVDNNDITEDSDQ